METRPAVTQADIEKGLRSIGLSSGDIVLLHSSLSSLGRVTGGAQTVVDAFLNVLGSEGTLAVPTFGDLGVITEVVRSHPKAVNSIHPLASVAAIGRDAQEICRDHWKAEFAHAEGTPYVRMAEKGGCVLLLGVDQDRSTTLHTVEEMLRAPYLNRSREVTFQTPDGEVTKSWPLFPGPHRDFIGIDRILMDSGRMTVGRIGSAVARLIRSRDLIDVMVEYGGKHPDWALCDNPNCKDCVRQRAALRNDRLDGESFRLAASARLAGRYVPEMIENLKAAAISAVELDYVQGRPAFTLNAGNLAALKQDFEAAGIRVSAVRAPAVTEDDGKMLAAVAESGVGRVLMPLSARSAAAAERAREKGLQVSFYNRDVSSALAGELLLAMKETGVSPRFTFSAANFAVSGEKPFAKSYKQKLRRFVDQLDVADATWGGEITELARGNAEIKEMMSILRCAGFEGWFVLTARNRIVGDLKDAADRLFELLEWM